MGVSKNVQNYKKSAIYQKPKTLKNYNFNPVFPPHDKTLMCFIEG